MTYCLKQPFKFYLLGIGLLLMACNQQEDQPPFSNEIVSENGLIIGLTWTTGGAEQQSLAEADLNLFVVDGSSAVIKSSTSTTSYEQTEFGVDMPDGTYRVRVSLFSRNQTKIPTYLLTLAGGGKGFNFVGNFPIQNPEVNQVVAQIVKTGNTYVIERR